MEQKNKIAVPFLATSSILISLVCSIFHSVLILEIKTRIMCTSSMQTRTAKLTKNL